VTAYEWERHLEWQFQDSYGVRGMQRWDLQPEANETKVIMRDEYVMPTMAGKILDHLITSRAVKLRGQSWLDRLKRFAERPDR
jgi:hypothetical protein